MQKSSREKWKSARTSSGIHREKKLSRLLKVGKRLIDSSDSESFEALENKPKHKLLKVGKRLIDSSEPKCKFTVEDDSSVMMGKGEEDDDT